MIRLMQAKSRPKSIFEQTKFGVPLAKTAAKLNHGNAILNKEGYPFNYTGDT